jgi:peptidyl-dipeptidase Dcp
MNKTEKKLDNIAVRTELKPGDLSFIIYKQTMLYYEEYNFGVDFESYAFAGMHEFCNNYNPEKDRIWICEHEGIIVGSLLLMHRENNSSQLRYFYTDSEYRGMGLGKKLMQLCMEFIRKKSYQSCYLWTTNELDSAISLYTRNGFKLAEEKESTAFGKKLHEQRYDLIIAN